MIDHHPIGVTIQELAAYNCDNRAEVAANAVHAPNC